MDHKLISLEILDQVKNQYRSGIDGTADWEYGRLRASKLHGDLIFSSRSYEGVRENWETASDQFLRRLQAIAAEGFGLTTYDKVLGKKVAFCVATHSRNDHIENSTNGLMIYSLKTQKSIHWREILYPSKSVFFIY